jgi:putative FmdB family regulatory protein
MPFYEYECQACKYYTEVMQKITDAALTRCPSCGKRRLKKLVSAPVFRLKGGGWYETDFKSDKENKRNLLAAEKEEPKLESKPEAKESKDTKPEGKEVKESRESKDSAAAPAKASAGGGAGGDRRSRGSAAPRAARAAAARRPSRPARSGKGRRGRR